MNRTIHTEPLTAEAFAPFGDVLDTNGSHDFMINDGEVKRFHDRGRIDCAAPGRAGLSTVLAKGMTLPHRLKMLERHPLGSQAFIPMQAEPWLITVAPDENGRPGTPRAFIAAPGQAINYHRGTWHGVLTPLGDPAIFAVVDWIGEGNNLEEYWLETPYMVELSAE